MTNTLDAREFQARLQSIEALLGKVERFTDPEARVQTREIVRAILDLHGTGLGRLLSHIEAAEGAGQAILDACGRDEVVGGLLLLHGLHPLDLETRVRQALEQVRPYLRSHGGNVELLGISDGVVSLRLEGSCHSCPSSAVTMQQTIEEAIISKAPDVTAVQVEGAITSVPTMEDGRLRLALPVL